MFLSLNGGFLRLMNYYGLDSFDSMLKDFQENIQENIPPNANLFLKYLPS